MPFWLSGFLRSGPELGNYWISCHLLFSFVLARGRHDIQCPKFGADFHSSRAGHMTGSLGWTVRGTSGSLDSNHLQTFALNQPSEISSGTSMTISHRHPKITPEIFRLTFVLWLGISHITLGKVSFQ
jgi:hypothetical protein